MTMQVNSPSFGADSPIPRQFTGEGNDTSPPLLWTNIPNDAQELAMIVDDPDAPRGKPFVHWVIYSIPPDASSLSAAISTTPELHCAPPVRQGLNDYGKTGYGGPLPPRGHGVHHYHFRIYALDSSLNLPPGLSADELKQAMSGHVLDEGELVGTYQR